MAVILFRMAEYKIRDIEILTGIRAHTIRIWEKRYGILVPSRTDTRIRTYTDSDVLLLLNIALLNRHGIKISRIAEMDDTEILDRAAKINLSGEADPEIGQLIVALISMNERLFRATLNQLKKEHGTLVAYQNYVLQFLERIGVMWQVGSINPAQEHFVANIIRQQLIAELETLPVPSGDGIKAILYLPEHEWHELGLLLYQYFLRSKGISTVYLGQSLPYASLLEAVEVVKPQVLVTAWVTSVDGKYYRNYFERLRKDLPHLKIVVGGYQSFEHRSELPPTVNVFQSLEELSVHFD